VEHVEAGTRRNGKGGWEDTIHTLARSQHKIQEVSRNIQVREVCHGKRRQEGELFGLPFCLSSLVGQKWKNTGTSRKEFKAFKLSVAGMSPVKKREMPGSLTAKCRGQYGDQVIGKGELSGEGRCVGPQRKKERIRPYLFPWREREGPSPKVAKKSQGANKQRPIGG